MSKCNDMCACAHIKKGGTRMNEETRQSLEAKVQSLDEELNAIHDAMPEAFKKQLIKDMADIRGVPAEEMTIDEAMQGFLIIDSATIVEIIKRAAGKAWVAQENEQDLPKITVKPTSKLNYPLDKPNSVIWGWDLIEEATKTNPNGQLKLKIDTSKKDSKQDAAIMYSINFDELPDGVKINKRLTQYDKRVYIAAATLFNAGNEVITATQVFGMMGNSKKPNVDDLQKVNDSLTKMGAARVMIDNAQEVQYAKGYKHFKYDASLLPFERMSAFVNGQLTESAIHLFREPPLITFAKERNQITTIDRRLLESPINKTEANLKIEDYLIRRIERMKNSKKNSKIPRKILFATIYDRCNIKTAKQKQRAPEKIRRYIDYYYKECGWIKGYIEEADGITIQL